MPKMSAMTEWSMTSSAGASGLIFFGSPPSSAIASRIVARSTMQGTPVKSCMTTRAGVNWISWSGSAVGSQFGERADVVGGDVLAVLGAQQVLEEHLQAERQLLGALHRVEPEDLVVGAVDREGRPWPRSCPCWLPLFCAYPSVVRLALVVHPRSSQFSRRAIGWGGPPSPGDLGHPAGLCGRPTHGATAVPPGGAVRVAPVLPGGASPG